MSRVALVVDDSMLIRKMVSVTLKALAFEVIEARDGAAALELTRGKALSLVVTDLNMPVMTGIEFLRELRKDADHGRTPVVFLTTESDARIRDEARSAGATAWVLKPFHPDHLGVVLRELGL